MQIIKANSDISATVVHLTPVSSRKLPAVIGKANMERSSAQPISKRGIHRHQLAFRNASTRFLIHTRDEIRVILFDDVIFCEAASNYTKIHLNGGIMVLVSKTLKDIETILYPFHFFRIHASYLINLHFIKRILKSQGCTVELSNNTKLQVSLSRREDLLLKMEIL
ncbi:MAG: LytTR family DNA-binding domain-containing protein [Saprospiraceae bacterium]